MFHGAILYWDITPSDSRRFHRQIRKNEINARVCNAMIATVSIDLLMRSLMPSQNVTTRGRKNASGSSNSGLDGMFPSPIRGVVLRGAVHADGL